MYDETRWHLEAGLQHLHYARSVALRTGLVEEMDRYGWGYGDPTSFGQMYEEVISSQAESLMRMLSSGEMSAEIVSGMFFVDDQTEDYSLVIEEGNLETRRLPFYDLDSVGGVATVPPEGSYVVVIEGPRRMVARFRGALACVDRNIAFFRRAGRTDAHFIVYLPDAEFDPLESTYPFFDELIRAWEILTGGGGGGVAAAS